MKREATKRDADHAAALEAKEAEKAAALEKKDAAIATLKKKVEKLEANHTATLAVFFEDFC